MTLDKPTLEGLLAAAIHESHDEAQDDVCWHWTGTLGEKVPVPGKDCEDMARRFLSSQSGQRLVSMAQAASELREANQRLRMGLAEVLRRSPGTPGGDYASEVLMDAASTGPEVVG